MDVDAHEARVSEARRQLVDLQAQRARDLDLAGAAWQAALRAAAADDVPAQTLARWSQVGSRGIDLVMRSPTPLRAV